MAVTTCAGVSARPVIIIEAGEVVESIWRVSSAATGACMTMVVFGFRGECI
jgi:hypothetical protein